MSPFLGLLTCPLLGVSFRRGAASRAASQGRELQRRFVDHDVVGMAAPSRIELSGTASRILLPAELAQGLAFEGQVLRRPKADDLQEDLRAVLMPEREVRDEGLWCSWRISPSRISCQPSRVGPNLSARDCSRDESNSSGGGR